MTVSDRQRLELLAALGESLGPEHAEVLMEYLPPVGWGDVARRHDVDLLRAELRGEMAELRGELRGEMAELRGAMVAGFERVQKEFHRDQARLLLALLTSQVLLAAAFVVAGGVG